MGILTKLQVSQQINKVIYFFQSISSHLLQDLYLESLNRFLPEDI